MQQQCARRLGIECIVNVEFQVAAGACMVGTSLVAPHCHHCRGASGAWSLPFLPLSEGPGVYTAVDGAMGVHLHLRAHARGPLQSHARLL